MSFSVCSLLSGNFCSAIRIPRAFLGWMPTRICRGEGKVKAGPHSEDPSRRSRTGRGSRRERVRWRCRRSPRNSRSRRPRSCRRSPPGSRSAPPPGRSSWKVVCLPASTAGLVGPAAGAAVHLVARTVRLGLASQPMVTLLFRSKPSVGVSIPEASQAVSARASRSSMMKRGEMTFSAGSLRLAGSVHSVSSSRVGATVRSSEPRGAGRSAGWGRGCRGVEKQHSCQPKDLLVIKCLWDKEMPRWDRGRWEGGAPGTGTEREPRNGAVTGW